jgi:anti-sigma factor RsiW
MTTKHCEDYEQLLSRQLDEDLPADQLQVLQNHLADCSACREFRTELTEQRRLLRSLPDFAVPEKRFAATIVPKWWQRRFSIPFPVAAAIALVALGGWLLALRSPSEQNFKLPAAPTLVCSVEIVRVPAVQAVRVETNNKKLNDSKEIL